MNKILYSAPFRKAKALANRAPRAIARLTASPHDYQTRPPIIVNSLPKSGTHLLMQVAQALPGTVQYGSFIAQTPSYSLKERSVGQVVNRIKSLAPGEIVGAHIYHNPAVAKAMDDRNALHLFIWRDPRDVLISEAHYLGEMARFHAMHKTFAAVAGKQDRIRMAIEGVDDRYGDCTKRVGAYMGWRGEHNTTVLRYEELTDPATQTAHLARIVTALNNRSGNDLDVQATVQRLIEAIDPEKSHTFHKGGAEKWRTEMDADNQRLALKYLKDWLPNEGI